MCYIYENESMFSLNKKKGNMNDEKWHDTAGWSPSICICMWSFLGRHHLSWIFIYSTTRSTDGRAQLRGCSWTLHCTSSCSNQHLPSLAIPITCGSHVHYILGSCRHRNLLLLVSTFRLGFNIHSLTNYSMGSLLAAVSTLLLPSQGKARDKPDRD